MDILLDFVLDNVRTLLVASAVLLVIYMYWTNSRDKKNQLLMPPGPPKLPLVGSLPFLGKDIREPLRKMADRYGEIMTVYLGPRKTIYLNSHDVIKEAFVKQGNSFAGRPRDLFFMSELCESMGIVSSDGELWREQRRFTHTVLKDLGMGRGALEPKVTEEIQAYLSVLESLDGSPTDVHFLTMKAVSNVVYSIINGKRNAYDDDYFDVYVRDLSRSFEVLGTSGIVMVFPFLRYLPGDPFKIKWIFSCKAFHDVEYKRKIHEHMESHDPENPRDLIDHYLTQMKEDQKRTQTLHFQLMHLTADLYGAGTETTSNTLLWALIYMLHYPDVMMRCQAEIDDVIGKHRTPSMMDKSAMPYMEATLMELQRISDIVPFGVPHTALEDVSLRGYYFPAGTEFMPNLYAVHHDPVTWPEPEVFKPTRHLTEDGRISKKEQLIPFSVGRRVCIGESLARMELFLWLTSILQRFHLVVPEGGQLPPLTGKLGFTHTPHTFKIVFKKRL